MATLKLTDKTILATRPEPKERVELWDEMTPGLCMRVSNPTGEQGGPFKRVWVWRYRAPDGRQPRLTLGDYGDKFGLKWARGRVEELRVQIRSGKEEDQDPAGKLRRERAAAKAQPLKTFDDLTDAYLTACEKGHWKPRRKQKRARTIDDERKILKRNARPILGKVRLEDIDKAMVRKLLNDMIDRGIGAQTNKTHALIRQVLAYGVGQERLGTNVAAAIEKPATETARSRVLLDPELNTFWSALQRFPNNLRLPPKKGQEEGTRVYAARPMRIALQLAALLLVRRVEIAGMARTELHLDQNVWIVPGERMKGGLPHLVPLPPRAVELIKEALTLSTPAKGDPGDPVFPSPRDRNKPMRADSVTHAMVNMFAALSITPASPHDLRRTGATALTSERIGIAPFVRSQVLAHRSDAGGGAAVSMTHYDVNTYVTEKRRALAAWEDLLLEIVGERPRDSNVSPMQGRAQ
jgi:integrase